MTYAYATLLKCPRCGQLHKRLAFRPLPTTVRDIDGDWTHVATCSKYANRILLRYTLETVTVMSVEHKGRIVADAFIIEARVMDTLDTLTKAIEQTAELQRALWQHRISVGGATLFNAQHVAHAAVG